MDSNQIRKNWIKFFTEEKKHKLVPSASLVPQNPTLLLVNAGMVPFVSCFLGEEQPESSRQVSIQKCVRVGGKDSDLENIGYTPRHLSFFEMLGNFSFGDYFKEEAILWSWELLTKVYAFQPENLIVSVFGGDQKLNLPEDQLAFKIWKNKIKIPEERIIKLPAKDNFWGPPGGINGPCGPCSEIYYKKDSQSEPVEIWNLVFMELEKNKDQTFSSLKKKNIDTGAGLERLACILQNKPTVFETDLLAPILQFLKNKVQKKTKNPDQATLKIIADHFRCSFMLLLDRIEPSNLGRGYITRMLIRRAARFGRLLGLKELFLESLLEPCLEIFKESYPEVLEQEKISRLKNILSKEEENFNRSIEKGLKQFEKLVKTSKRTKENKLLLSGQGVFELHATHGFPLELTIDLAKENKLEIDLTEYQKAKEKHAQVSDQNKFAHSLKSLNLNLSGIKATEDQFKYQIQKIQTGAISSFEAELQEFKIYEKHADLVLNRTCFYAESGGQIGDQGLIYLKLASQEQDSLLTCQVFDTQKVGKHVLHKIILKENQSENLAKFLEEAKKAKQALFLEVDLEKRNELAKHHTATHLLQAALRKNLKSYGKQAGSRVESTKTRFDFSYFRALSLEELKSVEEQVNLWIQADLKVQTISTSLKEALELGALSFEEDKYDPESVRVLKIGEKESTELCGGTHVQRTSEIGAVKIILESSISAGTRRIEMLAGKSAINYLIKNSEKLSLITRELKVQTAKAPQKILELKQEIKSEQKKNKDLQKILLNYKAQELLQKNLNKQEKFKLIIAEVEGLNLKELIEILSSKLQKDFLIFLINKIKEQNKVNYICKLSRNTEKLNAKEFTDYYSELIKGNSGGNQNFSQGGSGNLVLAREKIPALKIFIKSKTEKL